MHKESLWHRVETLALKNARLSMTKHGHHMDDLFLQSNVQPELYKSPWDDTVNLH